MSNAVWVEAFIVGCLFISLGSWMHWLRTASAERAIRSMCRRVAVVFLVSGVSFSILLVLMWTRLNSLHTMLHSNDPTALVIVDVGCATFAVWETVLCALAGRRV